MPNSNSIYLDFGSGEDSRFLSAFPRLLQPVCAGLAQVLTGVQVDLWEQVFNLLDLGLEVVEILGQKSEYLPKPLKGKRTVLFTEGGPVKLSREYSQDLRGNFLVEVHRGQRGDGPCGNGQYFKRALSAVDFLYNYWVVFSESQKFNRGLPLAKQFLLSDLLFPVKRLLHCSTTDHIKIFKYCSVYPLAAGRTLHKRPNPLPVVPLVYSEEVGREVESTEVVPWYVFPNAVGRRLESIVRGKATQNTIKLLHDIQETKRGCPVVPHEFVQTALRDHKKALSRPFQSPQGGEVEELLYGDSRPRLPRWSVMTGSWTEERLHQELPAVLEFLAPAIFGKKKVVPSDWAKCLPASTKACYERYSVLGGARGFLKDKIFEEFGLTPYCTSLWAMADRKAGLPFEVRTSILASDKDIMSFLWEQALSKEGPCFSQVKEILEPLKVRVITKSEAIPQYLSIPFQKALHGCLRKRKVFQLLDHPVEAGMINDLAQRSSHVEGTWVSGDYKGATDGLSQEISEIVARFSLKYLAPWLRGRELDLLMKNLVGQKIKYVLWDEDNGVFVEEFADQKNGQLMGSILSFPILCIVNYLTYFFSGSPLFYEYQSYRLGFRGTLTEKEFDEEICLINGDDILFKSSDIQYLNWTKTLPFFGFTLSVGKNLRSERFCMINSTLFYKVSKGSGADKDSFIEVKYPNLGLLKGRAKVCSADTVDDKPLWDVYAKIEEGFGQDLPKLYRAWNKDKLDRYAENGKRNYYGPRELGFCGLYDPDAVFTQPQLAWATAMYRGLTTHGPQESSPPGLCSQDGLVSGIADTWNYGTGLKSRVGKFVPRMCPCPPGYKETPPATREIKFHPFDGDFGEEPKVVFFKGSDFPKVYIPEAECLSAKRVLSLVHGFKFVWKSL